MKKAIQENENAIVQDVCNEIMHKYYQGKYYTIGQLRSCNAQVLNFEDYYVLKSYDTLVAAVSKNSGNTFDFLRLVFGYTATSAQHISKFKRDYAKNAVCNHVYRDI